MLPEAEQTKRSEEIKSITKEWLRLLAEGANIVAIRPINKKRFQENELKLNRIEVRFKALRVKLEEKYVEE